MCIVVYDRHTTTWLTDHEKRQQRQQFDRGKTEETRLTHVKTILLRMFLSHLLFFEGMHGPAVHQMPTVRSMAGGLMGSLCLFWCIICAERRVENAKWQVPTSVEKSEGHICELLLQICCLANIWGAGRALPKIAKGRSVESAAVGYWVCDRVRIHCDLHDIFIFWH